MSDSESTRSCVTMHRMTKGKLFSMKISPEILAALQAHCDAHGIAMSDLMRTAALEKIGRSDLLDTMLPNHRPAAEPPPQKPPRKPRRPQA